jgi:hypothetical protein
MNEPTGSVQEELRDTRAQVSALILEGLARRGLLLAGSQLAGLADNAQLAEVPHGA